jgi:hypothetical protein
MVFNATFNNFSFSYIVTVSFIDGEHVNHHQVRSSDRLESQIIVGSVKTKGPNHHSQNRLRSPIPEGGES